MAARVSSGARDCLVTLQGIADVKAASGMPMKTLTGTSYPLKAAKRELSQGERFVGDQVTARADYEWSLPYRREIDPDLVDVAKAFQLVYLGRVYDIVGAEMIGRRAGVAVKTLARVG